MKSILEDLYDGNIYPAELIISKNPEYQPLSQKVSDVMDMWRKKLSEDDYNQLESLLDLRSELGSMEASASFMYGFKLGALIMMEMLDGKGDVVRGRD